MMIFVFQWIYGQGSPVEFEFNQSTLQAFYFFNTVTINGVPISSDDWVAAFNGDICVGARLWDESNCGGGICDVPAMGDDGSSEMSGYLQGGDNPTFKIYNASSNMIFNAIPIEDVDSWSVNGFSMNELLNVEWSVNEANFEYNGSITVAVDFNDFVEESDMIAVLVDHGIRGIGVPEIFPVTNKWVFPLMIHSNEPSSEILEFVYYDSSSEKVMKLNESHEFTSDMIIGDAMDPFILTADYCASDLDDCGICGGNNSTCTDCAGTLYGDATIDNCDICDNDMTNDCIQDCNGDWGGTAVLDACEVCNGDGLSCLSLNVNEINSFSIGNVYPNPFNPVVNIDINCEVAVHLDLSIFSIAGKPLHSVFSGIITAGESTFSWMPKNKPSGCYLINASIDDQVKTQKVLFLK